VAWNGRSSIAMAVAGGFIRSAPDVQPRIGIHHLQLLRGRFPPRLVEAQIQLLSPSSPLCFC
jgi:hypothetical protein